MAQINTRMWNRWLAIICIVLAALFAGIWLQSVINKKPKPVKLKSGTYISTPISLSKFTLKDTNGQVFDNHRFKGHWSLVFFGFTHCPMICPTTLSELNSAYKHIPKKDRPNVLFITVDPKRDTANVLKNYLRNFNNAFTGITGNENEIRALTKQLGIAYMKAKKSNDKNYQIEHSGAIIVINPKGQWIGLLRSPHNGKVIANDFMTLKRRTS